MVDRFFPNLMPSFVKEDIQEEDKVIDEDSLMKLLSTPYTSLSKQFQRSGLDLKEKVTRTSLSFVFISLVVFVLFANVGTVCVLWDFCALQIVMETWGLSGQAIHDFTLYSGNLGTALLLYKSYQVTSNESDLFLCLGIVKACDSASLASRDVTFICGRAGVCALGAVAAKHANDEALQSYYLRRLGEIKLSRNHPDELLYGRSGFLWACLFLNKHMGLVTVPNTTIRAVVNEIIKNGRALAKKGGSPLMYEWYGERYWGAAHGLAGIMHVLLDVELKPDELEDVKGTLKYMINNCFPSGNYPISEEDRKRDVLVHWCHGAPGIALTLVKAVKVFGDKEFLDAAINAAEVVWSRGLLKRVGICHGISGNAYVFISLYQLTGNIEFLHKAKAFTCFLLDRAKKLTSAGEMHGGDSPYSMFEGMGGMAYLFLDMIDPSKAKFPAYEL